MTPATGVTYEAKRILLDEDGPSQILLGILAAADPLTPVTGPGVPLVMMCVCLGLSALFSGSEAGFLALSRIQLLEMEAQGHPRARLLLRLTENPADLVSTLLIANVTVNVLLAIAWSMLISSLLFNMPGSDHPTFALIRTILEVLVLTTILIILAEVTPKALAHNNPVPFCSVVAPILPPLMTVARPAVHIFKAIALRFLKLFGIEGERSAGVTEEEIIQYLAAGEESGVLAEDEREMIHSIFEFGDLEVAQVMVPRVDMSSVDEQATLEVAMQLALDVGHSRLPVHSGDRDHIVGLLHIKDVLRLLTQPAATEMRLVDSGLLRPATFVPERKPIAELFAEMKADKNHLVIVVDEYGGTAGLITIEDLLEELVGEIVDESDIEEPPFRFSRAGALLLDGQLALHELQDLVDWEAPENGVETLGGLVLAAINRVPELGEEVDLGGLSVVVEELEDNRIRTLRCIDPPLTLEARDIFLRQYPNVQTPLLPGERGAVPENGA